MAHNNHFYFDGISLTGTEKAMKPGLKRQLEENFSSVESLRTQFLTTAFAMFAPGFVWLVRKTPLSSMSYMSSFTSVKPEYHILCTYAAGSPYAGAHNRLQPMDMNAQNAGGPGGLDTQARVAASLNPALRRQHTIVQNKVGSFGSYSQTQTRSYGGVDVTPVLCVSTWEHAWLLDFTIEGKWQFLNAWWDRINWERVETRAGLS
jgi:superoxide dismutase, Fe-Mn family